MINKIQSLLHRHKTALIFFLTFVFFALCLIEVWWFFFRDTTLVSPITSDTSFRFLIPSNPVEKKQKIVYGFLPYWNISSFTLQPETTHLSYFSLGIGADGSILTKVDGQVETGYQKLGSDDLLTLFREQKQQGGRVDLTFTQFNNDDIVSFLTSARAHQQFLTSVDSLLDAYPIDGINIDIEYSGKVDDNLRKSFVTFMRTTKTHLEQKKSRPQLSVDMYVSAASKYLIWDVPEMQKYTDYIVIMAYDFHRKSSPAAGPVAPLFGGKKLWDSDIVHFVKDFVAVVPSSKLLLGIPFYGYEWKTISSESQSATFPESGSTATLKRVEQLLSQKQLGDVQEFWNEDALSPYLSYQKDGSTHIIYFENSRSISYKLDLVNQLDLAGVAIWSLGYEGNSRDLWDVIQRKL